MSRTLRRAQVHWGALPALLPAWLGLCAVVQFSASLDAAAVQLELGSGYDGVPVVPRREIAPSL